MKRIYLLLTVIGMAIMFGLQSCNNGKTYAERMEEEDDAIARYISENDIKVITEDQFEAQDSMTLEENEYVLLEESGVYMHIDYKGEGKNTLGTGSYDMIARFVEVALQTRTDDVGFEAGDTLMANMHIKNQNMMIDGEYFRLNVTDNSFSASFTRTDEYSMYYMYQTAAVPKGWLVPLVYLKPSRTNQADKLARVRLIVPHDQGTATAIQAVYPCFYEITYNLY